MLTSLVVTTIQPPTEAMRSLAEGARAAGWRFFVIGDAKGPAAFDLPAVDFLDLAAQRRSGFAFAEVCPTHTYARKAIGYLLALREGAEAIVETDDDNHPRGTFFSPRESTIAARRALGGGWTNAYTFFTENGVWPRGFPLERLHDPRPPEGGPLETLRAPLQQGLADENPDVDAVFRLTRRLPVSFRAASPVFLGDGAWCPFNSQNTTWLREIAALMYLPITCSFRMTDIWRSFVAQRVLWARGSGVTFHSATVWQERNEHDLMRDFRDELPGYLENARIAATLDGVALDGLSLPNQVSRCYDALIGIGVIDADERRTLDAWLSDIDTLADIA